MLVRVRCFGYRRVRHPSWMMCGARVLHTPAISDKPGVIHHHTCLAAVVPLPPAAAFSCLPLPAPARACAIITAMPDTMILTWRLLAWLLFTYSPPVTSFYLVKSTYFWRVLPSAAFLIH